MQNIIIITGIVLLITLLAFSLRILHRLNSYISDMNKTLSYQYNLIVKMQSTLKNKNATNTVAEHAEIIYQDLLQNLIPIMAAINVMPRPTNEHSLWRALGGIMDEYSKNPFALEKLRRSIKLDTNISQNIDNYITTANHLLQYLASAEPDGILVSTFTNGLLGQSLTFFTQAKELANRDE